MKKLNINMFAKISFGLVVAGLFTWRAIPSGGLEQPIKFNHKLHVTEAGLDCTECHRYVMTNRKATLPTDDICRDCHNEAQGKSSEEAKLVSLLQSGSGLAWKRIYVLPKHVYFSHFRHVTLGQLGCQECHGNMKNLSTPPEKPATNIISMNYCMGCHKARQISNDCLACHN